MKAEMKGKSESKKIECDTNTKLLSYYDRPAIRNASMCYFSFEVRVSIVKKLDVNIKLYQKMSLIQN